MFFLIDDIFHCVVSYFDDIKDIINISHICKYTYNYFYFNEYFCSNHTNYLPILKINITNYICNSIDNISDKHFFQFKNLKHLTLFSKYNCNFKHFYVPEKQIKNFNDKTFFSLSEFNFLDKTIIDTFSHLTHLVFYHCKLFCIPKNPNLLSLICYDCFLYCQFDNFKSNLTALKLTQCNFIIKYDDFIMLNSLQYLYIDKTNVNNVYDLAILTDLKYLEINDKLPLQIFKNLINIEFVKCLFIFHNPLDHPLYNFNSNLKYLEINTSISKKKHSSFFYFFPNLFYICSSIVFLINESYDIYDNIISHHSQIKFNYYDQYFN